MEKTYNGWSNYATWRINLELVDGIAWSDKETTFKEIQSLSEYIKDSVETMLEDYTDTEQSRLIKSYCDAFVEEVNFYEIATAVAENYPSLITGEDTQDGEPLEA